VVKQFVRILSLFFSFFSHIVLAQEQETTVSDNDESMVVNSGEAQYDGKEIIFVGHVVVQHGLGQISAHRLSLLPSSNQDKKGKFLFLNINDDVQLELRGGGRLYCQQATVDYAKMQGFFLGNGEWPDVIYLNTADGKDASEKARPSLEIKSLRMDLELLRESTSSSSSARTLVKQIEATENVRINYNQDFLLVADRALYQRLPGSEASLKDGLLTLSVQGDNPFCRMTNLNGDRLHSQNIRVNTVERKLWLGLPEGILYMNQEKLSPQTLEFSSNELIWDDPKQTLQLKGLVKITQNGTVQVQTDHEIFIIQDLVNGKRILRSIQSPQKTQISYLDSEKSHAHHIHCPGSLLIDHESQTISFQGLSDSSGQIEESQQVYIEDVLGEMYADYVHMNYIWQERQLVPEKIILEGHVRLLNRFDGHLEESGSLLHYALADRVECLPKQKEMTLDAAKNNRVLFFDKVNNVQMSAPSLKIRHDDTTGKDSIQGLGDVRFTFIEKELEQLKQRFRLEESSQKKVENGSSK
jgi:lipopolysaccharide export system protein LptA